MLIIAVYLIFHLPRITKHRHFVSVILEKLPQKIKYQLYMQKSEDEEWTVTKLRVLLGRYISAMEMAGSEEVPASSNSNRERSERSYENLRNQHLKSTAGGLLAGTSSKSPGNSQKGSQSHHPRCFYCSEAHWSDECSKCTSLQARKEKLKGCCFNSLRSGHVLKDCKVDRACAHCGKKGSHHRSLCNTLFQQSTSPQIISAESSSAEYKPEGAMVASTKC